MSSDCDSILESSRLKNAIGSRNEYRPLLFHHKPGSLSTSDLPKESILWVIGFVNKFFSFTPCHDDCGHCPDKPQWRWTDPYLGSAFGDDEPDGVSGIASAETWPSTTGLLEKRDEFSFQSRRPFSFEKKTVKFVVCLSWVQKNSVFHGSVCSWQSHGCRIYKNGLGPKDQFLVRGSSHNS